MIDAASRIQKLLAQLYGPSAPALWNELRPRLERVKRASGEPPSGLKGDLTERDAFLITYPDHITGPSRPPLAVLATFLERHAGAAISGVHLLPFYPYSSDDGFAVIDYLQVDPAVGTWQDVAAIGDGYRLMFDAVFNHISSKSEWFQAFKDGRAPYNDYFITPPGDADLSAVVRPRATPLLTEVETTNGARRVWTTFGPDQVDLNYANPAVLLEMIAVLLHYVAQGAGIIRLDATTYLWKEWGTTCTNRPQTHQVVRLFRAVLDEVAPWVLLITETNVPHQENVSYFGEPISDTGRYNEANLVYQIPLAPLVLHTFSTGQAGRLSSWAATLTTPGHNTTFFNFVASHDGIGLPAARELLTADEIDDLIAGTKAHGGTVSLKAESDGSTSAYELNITLYDALNDPGNPQPEEDVDRFMAAQVIMLSLAGVPGIYLGSLLGARNYQPKSGANSHNRTINREKFQLSRLESELADQGSIRGQVFERYLGLLSNRRSHPAFHPHAEQRVLQIHPAVFSLVRQAPSGGETILVLINVSAARVNPGIVPLEHGLPGSAMWQDIIGNRAITELDGKLQPDLAAYQCLWLVADR